MKERIRNFKYLKPASYFLFFVVMFVLFLVATFPGDIVKKKLISEIQNSTPYKVDIKTADVSALLNINLKGVTIHKSRTQFIELDTVNIKPSILSLLSDTQKIPFTATIHGGKVDGTLVANKKANKIQSIKADIKNLRIDAIADFLSKQGDSELLVHGRLNGNLSVAFTPQPQGDFDFIVEGLELDNLKVKGIKLPSLANLTSKFNGNIANELTNIDELSIVGDGIDIQITGSAPLVWDMSHGGILDLGYRVEITNKDLVKYKTFLSPYLAQHTDGSMGGKILGTVNNPRFEKDSVKIR